MLTPEQIELARTRLEERAAQLRAEVKALDDERAAMSGTQQGDDVADAAETGEQRSRDAVRAAEQDRDRAELRAVATALGRIEHGAYGICIDCGNDIPWNRLEVQPAAARDIACQQAWEQTHSSEIRAPLPAPTPR